MREFYLIGLNNLNYKLKDLNNFEHKIIRTWLTVLLNRKWIELTFNHVIQQYLCIVLSHLKFILGGGQETNHE